MAQQGMEGRKMRGNKRRGKAGQTVAESAHGKGLVAKKVHGTARCVTMWKAMAKNVVVGRIQSHKHGSEELGGGQLR